METYLRNTFNRVSEWLPREPEHWQQLIARLERIAALALNLALLLSVAGLLALTERTPIHFSLCASVLASWFVLGWLKK